jgi:hypothetical protein
MGLTLLLLLALVAPEPPAEKPKDAKPEPAKPADGPAKPKAEGKPAESPKSDGPAKPRRVADKSYSPAVGDRAVLYNADEKGEMFLIWAATTPAAFREYVKAEAMEDKKRVSELEKEEKVLVIDEDETPVVVLAVEPVAIPVSVEERGVRGVGATAVGVRILDGPHKGLVLITTAGLVARLRDAPEKTKGRRASATSKKKSPKTAAAKKPAVAAPKTADPAARAASLLRLGQSLEKSGKSAGALEYYRKVVKDYPGTPQAKTASARIEALGGK